MSDSPMVIMWPTRDDADADGYYASVTLSQRKAPYETMPTPDSDPPFVATLELAETSVCPFVLSRSFSRRLKTRLKICAIYPPLPRIRTPGRPLGLWR